MKSVGTGVVMLALAACTATPRPMLNLEQGKRHADQGYSSILVWRLRVQDETGTTLTRFHPRFVIGPPGSAARVASGVPEPMTPGQYLRTHYKATAVDGGWTTSDATSSFDGLYAVESRPGSYEIFQLVLDRKRTGTGSSAAIIQLSTGCEVPAGTVMHLGELTVAISGRDGQTYQFTVEGTSGDRPADLAKVDELFSGARDGLADGEPTCVYTGRVEGSAALDAPLP